MRRVDLKGWDWVAHPDCTKPSEEENKLIGNRGNILVIGEVADANASWSYDDWAIILFDKKYYLLNTSGCSCPSPTETWGIVFGPSSLRDLEEHITTAYDTEYSVVGRQMSEFTAIIEQEENRDKRKKI